MPLQADSTGKDHNTADSEKHIDPVCGMEVKPEEAACSLEFRGRKYYFCAESCRAQFESDPENFLARD